MNKKIIILIAIVLLAGIAGFFLRGVSFSKDIEKSYKTGVPEPRYLKEFQKTVRALPEDNSAATNVSEEKIVEIETALNNAGSSSQKFSWFSGIKDENIFVYVTDLGNLRFTLNINGGQFKVTRGFNESIKPTLTVPVEAVDLLGLESILSDGELTYNEQYMAYYLLMVPALQALYNNDALYLPGDKTFAKFDNFVQIEITSPNQAFYRNYPIRAEATAVNVDGQWLVFKGLQGDPDWKISMSLDGATNLYQMGVYGVREAMKSNDPVKMSDLSQRFLDFMNKSVTYVRSDHK
jgi:hypothetical protein